MGALQNVIHFYFNFYVFRMGICRDVEGEWSKQLLLYAAVVLKSNLSPTIVYVYACKISKKIKPKNSHTFLWFAC